jgi:hypothetical protein
VTTGNANTSRTTTIILLSRRIIFCPLGATSQSTHVYLESLYQYLKGNVYILP